MIHKSLLAQALLGLCLSGAALAAPAAPEKVAAATPATVSVKTFGDHVEVSITSASTLSLPRLRWSEKSHKLELSLAGQTVAAAKKWQVDKGLLQRVDVPEAGSLVVDVTAISNPRWKWVMAPDKKSLVWTISTLEIFKGDPGPVKAVGDVGPKPTPAKPAPGAGAKPAPAKAQEAPAKAAGKPIRRPPPVATAPTRPDPTPLPPPPAAPPATPLTAPNNNDVANRKVTLSYSNGDLAVALKAAAAAAGIQADIDPRVTGTVTGTFTDVPLNNAVTRMIGQQNTFYEYQITDKALRVYLPADSAAGQTLQPTAVASVVGSSEYFPIRDQKASDVVEKVCKKAVPNVKYSVDERLNVIVAEGSDADLERLRRLLAKIAVK